MILRLDRRPHKHTLPLLSLEWLDCDGCGGYASSTILNVPTRRYHGLLVSNLPEPASGRHVLVAGAVEEVAASGRVSCIGGVLFRDAAPAVLPPATFSPDPAPTWGWHVHGVTLRKRILLLPGRNAVVIEYQRQNAGTAPVQIRFTPLLAYRRNHALSTANSFLRSTPEPCRSGVCLKPYDRMPPLTIAGSEWSFQAGPQWMHGVFYREEARRGYPAEEDLFAPGTFTADLPVRGSLRLVLHAGTAPLPSAAEIARELTARRDRARTARSRAAAIPGNARAVRFRSRLALAAEQFLIRTPDGRPTVQAGYHWFEDWGRDTFIALPGLTFARGELNRGWEILCTYLRFERDGLLPNFIGPPGSTPSYNSVDAALWCFWTVQQYLAWGGDPERVVQNAWATLVRILHSLAVGAPGPDFGIRMESCGLLRAGAPDTQLTWMDAAIRERPVTPRWGLAVEVCALWYNALSFVQKFARRIGDPVRLPADPDQVRRAFIETFVLPGGRGLADVVNEAGADASVRPNQIFACSLPESPLPRAVARNVIATVRRELWTPRGLRTLAPHEPAYRGRYEGGPEVRDSAYHQGTAWPWLCGAFWEARLRWSSWAPPAVRAVRSEILGWAGHLREAGLGTVSEVFDGDAPQRPGGCIAQAWSVAELLRLAILLEKGPLACGY